MGRRDEKCKEREKGRGRAGREVAVGGERIEGGGDGANGVMRRMEGGGSARSRSLLIKGERLPAEVVGGRRRVRRDAENRVSEKGRETGKEIEGKRERGRGGGGAGAII